MHVTKAPGYLDNLGIEMVPPFLAERGLEGNPNPPKRESLNPKP